MNKKNLSKQALKRLPVYMSYLKSLDNSETEYISSSAVAQALDMNDVQVRKDLAAVCNRSILDSGIFSVVVIWVFVPFHHEGLAGNRIL